MSDIFAGADMALLNNGGAAMPDDTKALRQPKPFPESLMPGYAAFLGGGPQTFAHWMQAMFAVSQEVARFTQGRVQEDLAAWQALASCRSLEDAATCQQRFAAKAIEDYSDEITKLSQMMMKVATEGLSAAQQRPAVDA
jgi:Phasin protein